MVILRLCRQHRDMGDIRGWSILFSVSCTGIVTMPSRAAAEGQPELGDDVSTAEPASSALPEATWRALVDSHVELTRSDGTVVEGQLLEADETSATLVQADGMVVVVPKDAVTSVRRTVGPAPRSTPAEPPAESPAEPPAPQPPISEQQPPQPDPTEAERVPMWKHRGFYFAGMAGFGMPLHWDRYTGNAEPYDGTERIRSPGFNAAFALGGSVRPGLVLGFALDTNVGPATYEDDYRNTEAVFTGLIEHEGRAFSVGTSLFIQPYIKNFFFRVGFGGLGLFFVSDADDTSTGGMGFDLGFGAHFPVSRKAALGFSLGCRSAFWSYDDDDYKGTIVNVQPLLRFEAVTF